MWWVETVVGMVIIGGEVKEEKFECLDGILLFLS